MHVAEWSLKRTLKWYQNLFSNLIMKEVMGFYVTQITTTFVNRKLENMWSIFNFYHKICHNSIIFQPICINNISVESTKPAQNSYSNSFLCKLGYWLISG